MVVPLAAFLQKGFSQRCSTATSAFLENAD
jgi:hypothetical protein